MNVCPACGHRNAEHLPYCSDCGRRVRPPGVGVNGAAGTPGPTPTVPMLATGTASAGLAATVALSGSGSRAHTSGSAPATLDPPTGLVRQGFQAVGYIFATIRGRLDADERRRRLVGERDGALRLSEGTLTEVGQTILAQGIISPALEDLRETAQRLTERREGILADLAATEKFQVAEDLRLGLLEAAAESEWKTSDASVRAAEAALKKNESERREAREALARHDAALMTPSPPPPADREALDRRRTQLDEQHRALRERAAALSASMSATQARLDQASAARKQARAAVTASLTGRQRERSENESDLRTATARIGAQAIERRLPSPHLQGAYERFDRLAETVRTTEAELARLEDVGGVDQRKLAAGLAIIAGLITMASLVLWRLVR
jgi:hypothetical protein